MYISTKDWVNYIDRLSAINKKAAEEVMNWIHKNGFGDRQALIDYAYAVATKYGEASGSLSAAMYDATAEMEKKFYPPAEPAPTPEYGEVAKTVNGTLKHSDNPDLVANAIGRLVKRTGADTTLKNAERDGAQFAWVPHGDTCAFCITLASRGWQDISKKTLKNGHAEHIHANCDCTYAIRHSSDMDVEGYDPDKYLRMYYSAEGSKPEDRINAMRREHYALNKDEINRQKRAAYSARHDAKDRIDFRSVIRDNDNPQEINTRESKVIATPLEGSRNNLFLSEQATLKPKALNTLEKQVDIAKEAVGIDQKSGLRYVIVGDTELGSSTGGRFDPESNTMFIKQMVDKEKQQHVIVHESFHGKDYLDFISKGGQYTDKASYIAEISRKSKTKLDALGVTEYNVGDISGYASVMYRQGRFDEVYTEYRTAKVMRRR